MVSTSMTPLPSSESEILEESLCEIFEMSEQNIVLVDDVKKHLNHVVSGDSFNRLEKSSLILVEDGRVILTPLGQQSALMVVRRKRLAERLMKDVLNLPDSVVESAACQWEHVLSKEVTNSICTLLGHPTHSPRELKIPSGECCKREEKAVAPVICSLDQLKRGEKGKITYLLLKQRPELNRLLSMGLTPGAEILLLQRIPTFVIQLGGAQLAFDETIAEAVFVHPL